MKFCFSNIPELPDKNNYFRICGENLFESRAVKQFNKARMDKAAKVRLCDFVPCWNKGKSKLAVKNLARRTKKKKLTPALSFFRGEKLVRDWQKASVAELADAPGLGPGVQYGREGSNPFARSSLSIRTYVNLLSWLSSLRQRNSAEEFAGNPLQGLFFFAFFLYNRVLTVFRQFEKERKWKDKREGNS